VNSILFELRKIASQIRSTRVQALNDATPYQSNMASHVIPYKAVIGVSLQMRQQL